MTRFFSLMAQHHFSEFVANTISILDINNMEIGRVSNVSFERQKGELSVFQIVSATPKQKLLTNG